MTAIGRWYRPVKILILVSEYCLDFVAEAYKQKGLLIFAITGGGPEAFAICTPIQAENVSPARSRYVPILPRRECGGSDSEIFVCGPILRPRYGLAVRRETPVEIVTDNSRSL